MSDETKQKIDLPDAFPDHTSRVRDYWLAPYMMSVDGLIADYNRPAPVFEPEDQFVVDKTRTLSAHQPYSLHALEHYTMGDFGWTNPFPAGYDLVDQLLKHGFEVKTSAEVKTLEVTLPADYEAALLAARDRRRERDSYRETLEIFRKMYECHFDADWAVRSGRY